MFNKKLIATTIVATLLTTNVYAWGIGDLVGVGVQLGGKLIGAGIDKVSDSMRDPEAEAAQKREDERKAAAAFQKMVENIETTPNLRPIEREKLIISLQKQQQWAEQMQSLVEQSEAKQKIERDKIFTTSGFLGVVGEATINQATANVAVQNAAVMASNPVYRAQLKAQNEVVYRKADVEVAAGIPQAKTKVALAQADVAMKAGASGTLAAVAIHSQQTDAQASQDNPGVDHQEQIVQGNESRVTASKDAFMLDTGKALFVEFVGSTSKTQRLEKLLSNHGYHLVSVKEQADVIYLVEGEYSIPETKLYTGFSTDVGALMENPSMTLPVPEKKLSGSVSLGLSKFMIAMARAEGQQVPNEPLPQEGVYKQQVLVVIARQPKGGKETRFSVLKNIESAELNGVKMADSAIAELFDDLGLLDALPQVKFDTKIQISVLYKA